MQTDDVIERDRRLLVADWRACETHGPRHVVKRDCERLAARHFAKVRPVGRADDGSATKVGERERRFPVAAVGCPDKVEERFMFQDVQKPAIAFHRSARRLGAGELPYRAEHVGAGAPKRPDDIDDGDCGKASGHVFDADRTTAVIGMEVAGEQRRQILAEHLAAASPGQAEPRALAHGESVPQVGKGEGRGPVSAEARTEQGKHGDVRPDRQQLPVGCNRAARREVEREVADRCQRLVIVRSALVAREDAARHDGLRDRDRSLQVVQ